MNTIQFLANNPNAFLIFAGVVSLFIGSFLNVIIYRLPIMMERNWAEECRVFLGLKQQTDEEKLNLAWPPSRCPRCKTPIKPWHNIPIASYLLLGGKCAHCHTHISARYPSIEGLTCLLTLVVCWHFGFTLQCAAALLFTWICICLTFIDLDHHFLPDELTLSAVWLGLLFSIYTVFCDSHDAIVGTVIGYLVFAVTQYAFGMVTGKIGMGQGDYKFLAAIGAFLGWQMLPFVILVASLSGIVFALTQMLARQRYESVPLPFGPYLAIAGWITMLWGNQITQLYFRIL